MMLFHSRGMSWKRAARFITLNKTCYNGLYRVNRQGKFNVPMGYKNPCICDQGNLRNISKVLQGSQIHIELGDYKRILLENEKKATLLI